MTVTTTTSKVFATGNGVITEFDFSFKYFNASEIKAKVAGVITTAFTLEANEDGDGGTVTFTAAPANGAEVLIYREIALTQETRIPVQGTIPQGALENTLDKLTMLVQQVDEEVSRCLNISLENSDTFDPAMPSTLTASRAIMINASGTGLKLSTNDPDSIYTLAVTEANAAAASAAAALTSQTAAAASAVAAAASAAAAAASATTASEWAIKTSAAVSGSDYSAKEYAQGTQASTGGSAKNWAQQTGADVTGAAANSRSAKSWAQDVNTGATLGGSAKDWAQTAEDSPVDGTEFSAKHYAAKAAASAAAFQAASVTEALAGTLTTKQITPDTMAAIWEQGSDIASAATLSIPNTGGGYFFVTGTTTITKIDQATSAKTGREITLKFNGALTLTNNSNIILPGGANITTAAGDVARFRLEDVTASNQIWRCVSYMKASGVAVAVTAATTAVVGSVQLADQSTMETGTSTTTAVCPANQKFLLSHPKGQAAVNQTGTQALVGTAAGFSGIVDGGVGVTDFTHSTNFSSGNYSANASGVATSNGTNVCFQTISTMAVGSTRVITGASAGGGGGNADATYIQLIILGDL